MMTTDSEQLSLPAPTSALPAVRHESVATLAITPPTFAAPKTIGDIRMLGEMMAASGMFKDVKSASQAAVKIIAGAALGYDPVTSMGAFHVIEGKLALTAGEIGARVKRSGKYNYRVKELSDKACVLVFLERDGDKWMELGDSSWTREDAVAAGLIGKDVWKKYWRNMALSRAMTNGVRWFCPDLFGGPIYTPEELNQNVAIDGQGEMVVVSATVAPADDAPTARRALDGAALKALYADARAVDPSLPEDIRVWIQAVIAPDFGPKSKMTVALALAIEDELYGLLASGASVREQGAAVPAQTAPETLTYSELTAAIQAAATTIQDVATATQGRATASFAPPDDGLPMTAKTRAFLFASLADLGITAKADRLAFASTHGISVASFAALSDTQGTALGETAMRLRPCPACNAKPFESHAHGCPEKPL